MYIRVHVCVCEMCVSEMRMRQTGTWLFQMLLRDPGTELCWDESGPVPSER